MPRSGLAVIYCVCNQRFTGLGISVVISTSDHLPSLLSVQKDHSMGVKSVLIMIKF